MKQTYMGDSRSTDPTSFNCIIRIHVLALLNQESMLSTDWLIYTAADVSTWVKASTVIGTRTTASFRKKYRPGEVSTHNQTLTGNQGQLGKLGKFHCHAHMYGLKAIYPIFDLVCTCVEYRMLHVVQMVKWNKQMYFGWSVKWLPSAHVHLDLMYLHLCTAIGSTETASFDCS